MFQMANEAANQKRKKTLKPKMGRKWFPSPMSLMVGVTSGLNKSREWQGAVETSRSVNEKEDHLWSNLTG